MTKIIKAPGSILDVSKGDTALALMNAEVVLLCDRSGSMVAGTRQGRCRFQVEDEVVANLQKKHPGKIALVAFSNYAVLCLDGNLPMPDGGTNVVSALELALPLALTGVRVILVSDGEPEDEHETLDFARRHLKGLLDCIFIGDEGSEGDKFMKRLAREVSGRSETCDLNKQPAMLESKITTLLLGDGK